MIEDSGERSGGNVVWLCRCDCDNEIKVSQSNLCRGNTTKCSGSHLPDITGTKIGMLTAVEEMPYQPGEPRKWLARCDCGGTTVVRRATFTGQGHAREARSCGCLLKRSGSDHPLWKGCGDISPTVITFMEIRAKKKGFPCTVTVEYLWQVFQEQDGCCVLTGLPLVFATDAQQRVGIEQTASPDRIDSSKGYVEGNVQWVHKDYNEMKMDSTDDEFIAKCVNVAKHAYFKKYGKELAL